MPHERMIGVSVGQGKQKKGRREINIPSVDKKGKRYANDKAAIEAYFGSGKEGMLNRALGRKKSPNLKKVTKSYKDRKTATIAAKKRSEAAGEMLGNASNLTIKKRNK